MSGDLLTPEEIDTLLAAETTPMCFTVNETEPVVLEPGEEIGFTFERHFGDWGKTLDTLCVYAEVVEAVAERAEPRNWGAVYHECPECHYKWKIGKEEWHTDDCLGLRARELRGKQ